MRGIPACLLRALWMLGKHDRSLHDRSLHWSEDHRGCPRRRRRRRLTRPGRRIIAGHRRAQRAQASRWRMRANLQSAINASIASFAFNDFMVVIVCVIIVTGKRVRKKKKKIVTADIASVYYSFVK